MARLSGWLACSGWGVADLTEERVEEFLGVQRMVGRHRSQWSRPGLRCLLDVLRGLGVTGADPTPQTAAPVDVLLGSFARYLLVERGLADGTVRGYVDHARRFLAGVNADSLSGVTAGDVTQVSFPTEPERDNDRTDARYADLVTQNRLFCNESHRMVGITQRSA